jgi:opacity protein-like surface antigen
MTYLAASAAALVITTATLQAKDEPGFYAKVDAGGSFQQNLKIEGFDVSFNPGFRGDIGFGYNFCKAFAAEFETGAIWNSFDKVQGLPLAPHAEANLYQYPFLAKAIFKLPFENGLTPYVGAGAGGIGSTLHLKNSSVGLDESSSDFTFAYQFEAGLNYAVNEHIDVGVGYKFLGTTGYQFFHDPRTEDTFSHSIIASFTWNF